MNFLKPIAGKTGHRSPSTIGGREFTRLVGKGREIRYGVLIIELDMDMVVDFALNPLFLLSLIHPADT